MGLLPKIPLPEYSITAVAGKLLRSVLDFKATGTFGKETGFYPHEC